MSTVIQYRKEYLPQVIRLFAPAVERVDGRQAFYQQLFSLHRPPPEQSCLLLGAAKEILACVHFASLEGVQPNLLYANIAVANAISPADWDSFWQRCLELAKSLVPRSPLIRTAIPENSGRQETWGFQPIREQIELYAALAELPPIHERADSFRVVSLADAPHLRQRWIDTFNQGLSAFYSLPPIDLPCLQRLESTDGYSGEAFRLGLQDDEAVAALFYQAIDTNLGLARIYAPASASGGRGRGFGRRMLKETLNHLEQAGFKEAVLLADSASQATNLLYKMLGFQPRARIKILEYQLAPAQAAASPAKAEPIASPASDDDQGFFTKAHSAFEHKDTEPRADKEETGDLSHGFYPSAHSAYERKKTVKKPD